MPNLNKLAPKNSIFAVVDLTTSAKSLVNNEIATIKAHNLSFVDSLAKLNKKQRASSIICKALNYKARLDEDLVSEALLSLQVASIKYFEEDRTINFSQYAIIFIRKRVIDYLNKLNHTNGSDLHERIHSAIKAVKRCSGRAGFLTYAEAQHLANHFNLTGNDGIKKIQQLEAIQLGGEHDWKVNDKGEEYYRFDDQKNEIGGSGYQGNAPDKIFQNTYLNQQKVFLKKQASIFLKKCNKKEVVIFKARINCEEQVALNKLSKILNISFQMVSLIEKKLEKQFLAFCKEKLENKNSAGI